jgi:hypothetical protein
MRDSVEKIMKQGQKKNIFFCGCYLPEKEYIFLWLLSVHMYLLKHERDRQDGVNTQCLIWVQLLITKVCGSN